MPGVLFPARQNFWLAANQVGLTNSQNLTPAKSGLSLRFSARTTHSQQKLQTSENRTQVNLAGTWRFLPFNNAAGLDIPNMKTGRWPVMKLPSSWYLRGRKTLPPEINSLPRPRDHALDRQAQPHDKKVLDFSGEVWFSRTFNWERGTQKPVIVDLDMVDYYADVYLNGRHAGKHEGYFQKWNVNATRFIQPGENKITLRIASPQQIYDPTGRIPLSWPHNRQMIKGVFDFHDARPGAIGPSGQSRGTGGLIEGISVRQSSGVDLASVNVVPVKVNEKQARLRVETKIQNWTGKPILAKAQGTIKPHNFQSSVKIPVQFPIIAKPGLTTLSREITIRDPVLWWTWDYGKPNLYRLSMNIEDAETGATLDHQEKRFGIRSIAQDSNQQWFLNGKRVFPRGSNYISTQWLSQADKNWYKRDIRLMKEANLNAIRVHAHVERPEFYNQADEAGIMIWQDFPLQWSYVANPEFRREAVKQLKEMIERLKSHPSIMLWSTHNESPYFFDPELKRRSSADNKRMDLELVKTARREDPSRLVQRNSGTGETGHNQGDKHYYDGWYGGSPAGFERTIQNQSGGAQITEYGAQALPVLPTMKRIFDEDTLWPKTKKDWDAWKDANCQPKLMREQNGVSLGSNIQQFIQNSQQYQANLVRHATETFRRHKGEKTSGIFHFMLTDPWPGITWSVIDYFRRPKLGFEVLKRSMQPVLPSIQYDVCNPGAAVSLHVINDRHADYPGATLEWTVSNGNREIRREKTRLDVKADNAAKIVDLGVVNALEHDSGKLEVRLKAATGKILGYNVLRRSDFILYHPASGKTKAP
jgi:beta-mannosidase